MKEVEILSKLRDKLIIKLKNAFLLDKYLVIIMEYASGGELKSYLDEKSHLNELETRRIFKQLLIAVQYCHELGIVHRDLKLENVLFSDASKTSIRVVDFGIAGLLKTNGADKSKAGSLKYMAPEILSNKNLAARPSIDIWSMGCMLYAMLCGQLPFTGKTPNEVIEKIKKGIFEFPIEIELSTAVKDLIARMLTVDYKKRITINDIRSHPWVEDIYPENNDNEVLNKKSSCVQLGPNIRDSIRKVTIIKRNTKNDFALPRIKVTNDNKKVSLKNSVMNSNIKKFHNRGVSFAKPRKGTFAFEIHKNTKSILRQTNSSKGKDILMKDGNLKSVSKESHRFRNISTTLKKAGAVRRITIL